MTNYRHHHFSVTRPATVAVLHVLHND